MYTQTVKTKIQKITSGLVLLALVFGLGAFTAPKAAKAANIIDLDISAATITEGNSSVFTFTTERPAVGDITISYLFAAPGGADPVSHEFLFNGLPDEEGTITIPDGESSVAVILELDDDNLVESDEQLQFSVTAVANTGDPDPASYYTTEPRDLVFIDGDSTRKLSFASATASIDEDTSPSAYVVHLSSPAPAGGVTFSWSTVLNTVSTPGHAVLGTDFDDGSAGAHMTATIAEGQSIGIIPFTIEDDNIDENDEIIEVYISSPTNATVGAIPLQRITIEDNDSASVNFATDSSSENEDVTTRQAQLVLSTPSDREVTVFLATVAAQSTAEVGADWQLPVTSFVFAPGEVTKNVDVSVVNDGNEESDETATIRIATVGDATLGNTTTHTFTITNNDTAPVSTGGSGSGTAIPQSTASVGGVPVSSVVVTPPPVQPAPVVTPPPAPAPTTPGEVLGVQISLVDELIVRLNYGQTSNEVNTLQTELQKLGFFPATVKTTRFYGPITKKAVENYLDSKIWTLDQLVAMLKFRNRGASVVRLQDQLKSLGHFPLTVRSTGFYYVITRASVAKYKASR